MTVADLKIKNLPENVDFLVLDGLGLLQADVGLEELLRYLSDLQRLSSGSMATAPRAGKRVLRKAAEGGLRIRRAMGRKLLLEEPPAKGGYLR
jgi:hypothetical protein